MHILNLINNRHSKRQFLHSLRQNNSGSTAIEFALLGIPFMALLFGIIELSVIFFVSSAVHNATAEIARDIRTGEFQSTGGGATQFKAAICTAMNTVGNCNKLHIDVVYSTTGEFSAAILPPSQKCTGSLAQIKACLAGTLTLPADSYSDTSGGDVVIVRVQYFYPLSIPSALTKLANSADNTHIITATTAFKNEPF